MAEDVCDYLAKTGSTIDEKVHLDVCMIMILQMVGSNFKHNLIFDSKSSGRERWVEVDARRRKRKVKADRKGISDRF